MLADSLLKLDIYFLVPFWPLYPFTPSIPSLTWLYCLPLFHFWSVFLSSPTSPFLVCWTLPMFTLPRYKCQLVKQPSPLKAVPCLGKWGWAV